MPPQRIRAWEQAKLGQEATERQQRQREKRARLRAEEAEREKARIARLAHRERERRHQEGAQVIAAAVRVGTDSETEEESASDLDQAPPSKRPRRALLGYVTTLELTAKVANHATTTFKVLTHGDCSTNRQAEVRQPTHAQHTHTHTHLACG